MKKSISIILLLSVITLLVFTGCTDNENNPVAGNDYIDYSTDMQVMYKSGDMTLTMTKSDNGYYYFGDDGILIYIDKQTNQATPLCAKPDCMHTNPETCNAYINVPKSSLSGNGTAIQYYDGSLYMVCGEYDKSYIEYNTYLMKMNTDGSGREKITDYFDFSFKDWFIHRGYFYYATDSSILRIPLDSPKSEPETVYKTDYFIEDSRNTYHSIISYKNYLYFDVNEKDEEGNGEGSHSLCVNLDTFEKNPKFTEITDSIGGFIGDSMILIGYDGKDNKLIYTRADLDGGNAKEISSLQRKELKTFSSDGKYFYLDNMAGTLNNLSKDYIINVYDENMQEVDSFKHPISGKGYNMFYPQDEDFFLFEAYNDKDDHVLVMADKSQIGSIGGDTIKYKELCKLKWAENTAQNYVKAE